MRVPLPLQLSFQDLSAKAHPQMAFPQEWAVEEPTGRLMDLSITQSWPFWCQPGGSRWNKLGLGPGTSLSSLASPGLSPWRACCLRKQSYCLPFSLPLGMGAVCMGGGEGGALERLQLWLRQHPCPHLVTWVGRGRAGLRGSQVRIWPGKGQKASWAQGASGPWNAAHRRQRSALVSRPHGAPPHVIPAGNECPLV